MSTPECRRTSPKSAVLLWVSDSIWCSPPQLWRDRAEHCNLQAQASFGFWAANKFITHGYFTARAKQKSLWPSCTETEDSGAEQCDSHQDPFTGTTGSQHQHHRGINILSYYIELSALILPEKAGNSIFRSHRNVMALAIFKSMLTEVQRPPAIKDLACLINYPFQHYPTSWQTHIALKNREQKVGTNLKITSPSPLSPRWISCIWELAENSFLQTQSQS